MARSIVIAVPSYLMKRGISAIISDIVQADIIFVDGMDELNHYLESNPVEGVLIDADLLEKKDDRDLFFQLQHQAKYVVLAGENRQIPSGDKFQAAIGKKAPKEKIIPVLEEIFGESTKEKNAKGSILSEREIEVLKQVALGYTNQEIADRLFISKHTVISHRKNITSKLGIKTVSGLTVYAVLNDLIPKDQIQ